MPTLPQAVTEPGLRSVLPATTPGGSGWLYDLLAKAGVSPSSARSVVEFVVRPLEIVLVLVVAALLAHFGAKAIRRWFGRLAQQAAGRSSSPRAGARAATVSALVANAWRFVVVLVVIGVVLGMLGVNLTPLLASATVIGATIGFGAQALVRDYLSGALLTMEDQFGIGDAIAVNGVTGVVEDVSLRVTRVRSADGTLWYVPNGEIRKLGNSSRGWAKAVVEVPVTPGTGSRIAAVREAVLAAAREVAARPRFAPGCPEPPEITGVAAADASSYTLQVMLRTRPADRDGLERAVREAVVDRLLAEGAWPTPSPADGTGPAAPSGGASGPPGPVAEG